METVGYLERKSKHPSWCICEFQKTFFRFSHIGEIKTWNHRVIRVLLRRSNLQGGSWIHLQEVRVKEFIIKVPNQLRDAFGHISLEVHAITWVSYYYSYQSRKWVCFNCKNFNSISNFFLGFGNPRSGFFLGFLSLSFPLCNHIVSCF